MAAALAWAGLELRARWRATLVLALMVGLGGGVALATAAGARRTNTAFDRFLDATDYIDTRVQYSSLDDVDGEVLQRLRTHPDVDVAVPLFLNVAFSTRSDLDLAVFNSPDEAFLRDIDRPRLIAGRLPDPDQPGEVVANRFTADSIDVAVGESFTLATFAAEQFADEDFARAPDGPELELTLVGFVRTPDELADSSFVGLFATPAFHQRYNAAAGGFGPIVEVSIREGADGELAIREALDGMSLDELFVEGRDALTTRVTDATRVLALGLTAFAVCAALAALVACGQALARRLSTLGPDLAVLRAMGMTARHRRLGALATALPVALGGALGALTVAWLASPLFPIGIARAAEPERGPSFDVATLVVGGITVGLIVTGAGALAAVRLTRAAAGPSPQGGALASGPARPSMFVGAARRAVRSPVAGLGVAMALEPGRGRAAVPVRPAITGAVVGITGVVAALTFGASLDHLLDNPAQYGWNWTLSPDILPEDEAEDIPRLVAVAGVLDVGRLRYGQLVAGADELTGLALETVAGAPSLTVLDGRLPERDDEVAVEAALAGSVTVYARPSPPSAVANLAGVRGLPLALAAFLVVVALGAIGHAVATAVRRRSRELGIVRALGVLRRQVWGIVAVQSLTLLGIGLLLGLPLGIATGRIVWMLVADSLGVTPSAIAPRLALVLLVPVAVVAGLLRAAWPARTATRGRPAEVLAAD